VTVLVGALGDVSSPARADSPLLGADLDLRPGTTELPVRDDFEHALIVLLGTLEVGSQSVRPGQLAYLGTGRDALSVTAPESARAILLGGETFPEPILMWWNFVARQREEINAAHADWQSGSERFGRVDSRLARIPAPPLVWSVGG
jgi:hypothetical protein